MGPLPKHAQPRAGSRMATCRKKGIGGHTPHTGSTLVPRNGQLASLQSPGQRNGGLNARRWKRKEVEALGHCNLAATKPRSPWCCVLEVEARAPLPKPSSNATAGPSKSHPSCSHRIVAFVLVFPLPSCQPQPLTPASCQDLATHLRAKKDHRLCIPRPGDTIFSSGAK